jgi:hypothetical protein
MSKLSKYFREAEEVVTEKFHNADGWDNAGGEELINADGGSNAHKNGVTTSDPYVVRVANANLVDTNATLFGSWDNRTAANFGNPAGITITCTNGISYGFLLGMTEDKAFKIGKIYIEAITGSNSVVTAVLSTVTKDGNGNIDTRPKYPKKDPNQQQAGLLEFYSSWNINGGVSWTVTIPASTTVEYTIYPMETINVARALNGGSPKANYADAPIGKAQRIIMSPAMIKAIKQA